MWPSKPRRRLTGMAWLSLSSLRRPGRSLLLSAVPLMRSTPPLRPSSARNLNRLIGSITGKESGLDWWICTKRPMTTLRSPSMWIVTPEYRPKFDALLVELKEAEEKSLNESERFEKEIEEVKELKKKISTMTADEYFEKHPELKKKFDDEIRNDYWGY